MLENDTTENNKLYRYVHVLNICDMYQQHKEKGNSTEKGQICFRMVSCLYTCISSVCASM